MFTFAKFVLEIHLGVKRLQLKHQCVRSSGEGATVLVGEEQTTLVVGELAHRYNASTSRRSEAAMERLMDPSNGSGLARCFCGGFGGGRALLVDDLF